MKQQIQVGIAIAVAVGAMAVAALLVVKLAPLLLLVLIAVVISTSIDPLVQWLQRITVRGWAVPRAMATLLILLAALLVLLGILTFFTVYVVNQSISFANNVWPDMREGMERSLRHLAAQYPSIIPPPETISQKLSAQSGQIAGYLWSTTRAVFGVIGGLFSLISIFILTLFFTVSKDGIAYTLLQFVPSRHHARTAAIAHEVAEKMGGWLRGQLLLAFIVMAATMIAMYCCGSVRQYAAIIGLIGGLGELIPLIGPFAAFFPAIIIAVVTKASPGEIIFILIFFSVLSQVENYLLAPKIMERHVKLSPVTTIFSLLAGGALLGIVGALLAIPLAAALRVVLFAAVFPAIQDRSRQEIELGCPGARPKPAPAASTARLLTIVPARPVEPVSATGRKA